MIVYRQCFSASYCYVFTCVSLVSAIVGLAAEYPLEWEFRLAGGPTGLSGRVEMRPNSTAPWGTICKDLFKENNFGPIAACNSAGLVGVTQALYKTTFGPGTGPIYLTDVACTASTTFIQNCSRSPLLQTGACVHFEDVGVECSPPITQWQFKMVNGTAPSNGLVLIKPMPSLPWGALSNARFLDVIWQRNRQVMCTSLGYPNVTAAGSGNPTSSPYNADPSLTPYVVFGDCPAAAATIDGCPYSNFGSVSFAAGSFLVLDCAPPPPTFLPAGVEVSLVNGVTPWSGAILIRPNTSFPWGVILREEVASMNWFSTSPLYSQVITSAQQSMLNAVCHSAGFPSATKAIGGKYGQYTPITTWDASSRSIVYYQTFNCTGAFNLTDCIAGPSAYTASTNNREEYAGVDCFPDPPTYDQWEYRLNTAGVTAAPNGTGYVEMRPKNTSSPWLGICPTSDLSPPLMDGLCRKLGFGGMGTASLSYAVAFPALGRKQYYLGFRPSCPRKESPSWELPDDMNIDNCTLSPSGMHNCGGNLDVKLNCLFPKIEEMSVRVSDGGAPWRGRVEILPRAGYVWGTIATQNTFHALPAISRVYVAFAICRSIGFLGPNVTNPVLKFGFFPQVPFGTPQYWNNPNCFANSTYLNNCTYGLYNAFGEWGPGNHAVDIGIDCFPSPFEPRVVLEGAGIGVAGKGRIMIQYNPNIPFGSVCNDLFKHNHFAWNAACRSAGFLNVTRTAYQSFGPAASSAPIALDDVVCTEADRFLQNCSHRAYGQNNCHHGEDAGVDCYPPPEVTTPWQFRLADGTAATNGRVEMRPSSAFPWGSICAGPYFNHTVAAWEAACRSVGIASPPRARWRYFPKGSDTVYLDNVSCAAGNVTLVDCDRFPLGSYRCDPTEIAGVDCDAPAETPQQWQFRLVGGWTATSGRLEMRPDAATAWGGVCRHGLQHFEALRAVCRSTGHAAATRPVLYRPLGPSPASMMPLSQPFYLDDAICNHTTPYLHNCSYAPLYSHDCDPLADALFVECMSTLTAEATPTRNTSSPTPTATGTKVLTAASATPSRSSPPPTNTATVPQTPTGGWPKAAFTATANVTATATAQPTPSQTLVISASGPPHATRSRSTARGDSPTGSHTTTLHAPFTLTAPDNATPTTAQNATRTLPQISTRSASGPSSRSASAFPYNGSRTEPRHPTPTAIVLATPTAANRLSESLSPPQTRTQPTAHATPTPRTTASGALRHTLTQTIADTAGLHTTPHTTASGAFHRTPTLTVADTAGLATTPQPPPATGSAPCPLNSATVEVGTTIAAVRGPHAVDLRLPAPVLLSSAAAVVVPLPPQVPAGAVDDDAGIECRVVTADVVRCELSILDEKAVTSAVTVTLAIPAALVTPNCVDRLDVRVSLTLLPAPDDASLAVTAVLTAAAGTTRFVFLADPTAFDSMAVVVALVSRCATATDAAMARWARYLLSPLIDLGPTVVGLIHALVPISIVLLHTATVVVSARLRRSYARHARQLDDGDDALLPPSPPPPAINAAASPTHTTPTSYQKAALFLTLAARWRFPGASMAVAVLLYPGAAWALAAHISRSTGTTDTNSAATAGVMVLLCLFLAAVPVVAAFCLIRVDVSAVFRVFSAAEQPPTTGSRSQVSARVRVVAFLKLACVPRGVWGPDASRRSFGPLYGLTAGSRPAVRWALLPGACAVLLLVCALIGAPTRGDACRGVHAAAAAIVFVATAALAAVSVTTGRGSIFATPLTAALTVVGGLSLGALLAAQAAAANDTNNPNQAATSAIKTAAVVINATAGILRSVHAAGIWWLLRRRNHSLQYSDDNDHRGNHNNGENDCGKHESVQGTGLSALMESDPLTAPPVLLES